MESKGDDKKQKMAKSQEVLVGTDDPSIYGNVLVLLFAMVALSAVIPHGPVGFNLMLASNSCCRVLRIAVPPCPVLS